MAVGGAAFLLALLWINLGFDFISPWAVIDISTPHNLWLGAICILWYFFSIAGFGWVLFKKNRHPLFLIVYLVVIGLFITSWLYTELFTEQRWITVFSFESSRLAIAGPIIAIWQFLEQPPLTSYIEDVTVPVLYFFIGIAYVIAWTTVIALTHKDSRQATWLAAVYSSGQRFTRISICMLLPIIGISVFASVFIDSGYLRFDSWDLNVKKSPRFTYEYPADFSEPRSVFFPEEEARTNQVAVIHYVLFNSQEEDGLIRVMYVPDDEREKLGEIPRIDNETYPYLKESHITVAGNQATVYHQYSDVFPPDTPVNRGTFIQIIFRSHGGTWIIVWQDGRHEVTDLPAYFTRLLETFTIYD